MARNIVVSCLGPRPLEVDPASSIDAAREAMQGYLVKHVGQVVPDTPDIIVLPEMCDRPDAFSLSKRKEYYRRMGGANIDLMRSVARKHHCYVAFPTMREREDGSWRNTTFLIDRSGEIAGTYDKNHVVIEETTEAGILCGTDGRLIECDFGEAACAICFDLQFDELRLRYKELAPRLILFSSRYHGGMNQAFWAFTCRSWFAGAVSGLPCSIVSPIGETVAASTVNQDFVSARINLDYAVVHLDHNLERFDEVKRRYGRDVVIHEPGEGYLDVALLTCESEELSMEQIMRETGLEPLDHYLARSQAHRDEPKNRAREDTRHES
jgi:predicted amidohydrolase